MRASSPDITGAADGCCEDDVALIVDEAWAPTCPSTPDLPACSSLKTLRVVAE